MAILKLRQGSYFPHWLLERRRRAEQASSRWSPPPTCSASVRAGSRSSPSPWSSHNCRVPEERDGQAPGRAVAAFRNRPLDQGPYAFVWADALTQKVREGVVMLFRVWAV
ncbi:transposase [Streptomyces sp. NBC_00289]|uniref:transposase n=1 Tax=Streptomyces sp. NBC_00289 TaxID=2975703 RepID=UPI00352EA1BD